MRAVVAVEGTVSSDGRLIPPGTLEFYRAADEECACPSDQIPFLGLDGLVAGYAYDLERDGTEILASVVWVDRYWGAWAWERAAEQGLSLAVSLDRAGFEDVDGLLILMTGRIRAIYLTDAPCWPECAL